MQFRKPYVTPKTERKFMFRYQLLVVIFFIWFILYSLTYLVSKIVLTDIYNNVEENNIEEQLNRANKAIDEIKSSISTNASSWAHNSNAYLFITSKDSKFIRDNITEDFIKNTQLNLILFLSSNNKLFYGILANMPNKVTIQLTPSELTNYFPASAIQNSTINNLDGFIATPAGIMLIASRPIINNATNTFGGSLIIGRYFDNDLLQKIGYIANGSFTIYDSTAIKNDPKLMNAYSHALQKPNYTPQMLNEQANFVYFVINDINNKPIALAELKLPTIFSSFKKIHHYFLIVLIAILILNIVLWWLVQGIALGRLLNLHRQISQLGTKNDFSQRIAILHDDGLVIVINKINELLDIIEESQEKLEQRVAERTRELQNSNIKLLQEISERKTAEKALEINKEQLNYAENFDVLTDLPNRVLFSGLLHKVIEEAKLTKKMIAILILDLDRFKNINDSMGHAVGDKLLRLVAQRLKQGRINEKAIARLGGDEFIILTHGITDISQVSSIAQKILNIFNEPFLIDNREFHIKASIGISIFPKDASTFEDLLKNADLAMYHAKKTGGATFHYYTNEMEKWSHDIIELESNLRKAIINNEFSVYYQPIINLADKTIVSLEALIRWNHPEFGFIAPTVFIPVAEETGLILQIGEFVLREACLTNKSWQNEGFVPINIAVNLSPIQFRDRNLVNTIKKILKETQLDPKYLEFEITEGTVMQTDTSTLEKLKDIHDMGINIAIDDFGTGFSSISYLKQFPIKIIKIDQSFVKGIPDDPEDMAITKSIITLAHNLGFKVIAEGIETQAQLNYLIEQGCDMGQGFIFSKPLSKDKIRLQFFKIGIH